MTRAQACALVDAELDRALKKHPIVRDDPRHHHSVMEEEFDEFWDALKADDLEGARKEAAQVASTALRYLMETTP